MEGHQAFLTLSFVKHIADTEGCYLLRLIGSRKIEISSIISL